MAVSTGQIEAPAKGQAVTDKEIYWISSLAQRGFSYDVIAAIVYNLPRGSVPMRLRRRVGRVARRVQAGVESYRKASNKQALMDIWNQIKSSRPDPTTRLKRRFTQLRQLLSV